MSHQKLRDSQHREAASRAGVWLMLLLLLVLAPVDLGLFVALRTLANNSQDQTIFLIVESLFRVQP